MSSTPRLTHSNTPFIKAPQPKSPSKVSRSDVDLSLRQVIGATCSSANAFDSLPSERTFAFTAGAAAVIATIDDAAQVSQRFFRARPTTSAVNTTSSIYGTPTPSNNTNRTAASLRDAGIGASPGGDYGDYGRNTARERIKAATCVSFSPDGKYLAVGETGYKPRVLVFSTATDAPPDVPLTTMSEHAFGVRCVSFSPDSQYLASLGSANDGYLYIWSLNSRTGAATLHASNKCTNHVNKMAWLGSSLVVVGVRHVKVWRIDEAQAQTQPHGKARQSDVNIFSSAYNKTLPGRNCLLGSLLEANFTYVVPVAPAMAIISTDKGDICLLDDTDRTQKFTRVANVNFGVSAMAAGTDGRLHVAGFNGDTATLDIKKLMEITPPPSPTSPEASPCPSPTSPTFKETVTHLIAMAPINDLLVTLDSKRAIRLVKIENDDDSTPTTTVIQQLPAQGEGVLGVRALTQPNSFDASFLTWSAGGTIMLWNKDGSSKGNIVVPLEQLGTLDEPNELRVVRASPTVDFLTAGDKYGLLSIIDCKTGSSVYSFKAHSSELTDIAIYQGQVTLIATASRDRTVQVFQKRDDTWDLLQTLDEHVGAVTGVLFSTDGQRLLSSSVDRTVVVRDYMTREEDGATITAFVILRTITLKSTPSSMILDADRDDTVVLSTVDRYVHKYDVRSGQALSNFKVTDPESGDTVVLSSLVHILTAKGQGVIAGVSSTDKSVRLYEENGNLLGRDWGHTEGVTDIAAIASEEKDSEADQKCLVTVAADGTIFLWDLDFKASQPRTDEITKSSDSTGVSTPNRNLLSTKQPLRRVMSQSEIAKFQRSSEDDGVHTPSRSPKQLKKKGSKVSLHGTPRLEPSPMHKSREHHLVAQHSNRSLRHGRTGRSPSPGSPKSPKSPKSPRGSRRPSIDSRPATRGAGSSNKENGSLAHSNEQLCRMLRVYRRKLQTSSERLGPEAAKELERELNLTVQAMSDKTKHSKVIDDSVMVRLLDQYSERLIEMLDEKISSSVAQHIRKFSDSAASAESGLTAGKVEESDNASADEEAVAGHEQDIE